MSMITPHRGHEYAEGMEGREERKRRERREGIFVDIKCFFLKSEVFYTFINIDIAFKEDFVLYVHKSI